MKNISELQKYFKPGNILLNYKIQDKGVCFNFSNDSFFVNASKKEIEERLDINLDDISRIKIIGDRIKNENKKQSTIYENFKLKDVFLQKRDTEDGFVLVNGCNMPHDGFGSWTRGVSEWLTDN